MKRFLVWFKVWGGIGSLIILILLGAKWTGDAYKANQRAEEARRIEDEKEISNQEYQELLGRSLKYTSFKFLIHDKLYGDLKISRKEFRELTSIYERISMFDHLNLLLQEKSHVGDLEGQ